MNSKSFISISLDRHLINKI